MTNLEFYADKIKKLGIYDVAVDKETGEPCECGGKNCDECLLSSHKPENAGIHCTNTFLNWLLEEHKEPEVDWSKVAVDTPIYVSDDNVYWANRHFAKYENGVVYAWFNGATSFSTPTDKTDEWRYAKLAKKEDGNA